MIKKTKHQTKIYLKEVIEKAKLEKSDFRELFVSLFTKQTSYTLDNTEMAMRFFELAKPFYQFYNVDCAICNKDTYIGSVDYLKGLVINGFEIKWICENCKNEIRELLGDEL